MQWQQRNYRYGGKFQWLITVLVVDAVSHKIFVTLPLNLGATKCSKFCLST
jgi:hypothetical protein